MANITYPDKSQGISSTFPTDKTWRYQDANEVKDVVNTNSTQTDTNTGNIATNTSALANKRDLLTQLIDVEALSDLPSPSSGVIDLNVPNRTYRFAAIVDIGTNRIEITANNVKLCGFFSASNGITSTTTGALITSTMSVTIEKVVLIAPLSYKIFDLTNSSTEVVSIVSSVFPSSVALGSITDYATVFISTCVFESFSVGLVLDGTMDEVLIEDNLVSSFTGTFLDLNGAVAFAIAISSHSVKAGAGATFLELAASGANITSNGQGTIFGNKINDAGGGIAISGYTSFELKWAVGNNTSNIKTSDRLVPNGWGFYVDAATTPATQTINTTPSKLQNDGAGANSESNFLPISIRGGISELWDVVNDKILGITGGDSYDLRVNLNITSKTGSPNALILALDIGGGVSPTIVIAETESGVTKAPPFDVIFTFPFFTLSTFITNGGQLFLSTDTGSLTLGDRTILITRTSSGAG